MGKVIFCACLRDDAVCTMTEIDFSAFPSQNVCSQVGVGNIVRQHCFEKHGKDIRMDTQGFKLM